MAIGTGAALIGSAVVGAGASMFAGNKAAKAQSSAANRAAANERAMFEAQRADNQLGYTRGRNDINNNFGVAANKLEPFNDYGTAGTRQLASLAGLNGVSPMAALRQDPGYQFRMTEGVNALDRSAASRGMLQSGAQQKALTSFGQGLASDELNNAYNRVQGVTNGAQQASGALASLYQNRGTTLGNLATGQASQNQALSQNTSNALGQYAMGAGQARAQGYENMGSSVNAGIQNGLTAYMMQQQRPGVYGNNYGSIGGMPYNGPR